MSGENSSLSHSTGLPPALIMEIIVAKKVLVGTITSLSFISIVLKAISRAAVPF